ncbi:MAG: L,D-transpeptidase [Solirubrobacterales bacterium]
MARPLQRPDLAVVLAFAVFAVAVLWMVLEISGKSGAGVPDLAAPAAAAEPAPSSPAPPERQPAPEPTGRENPLVPLPSNGTPVLEVRQGEQVALSAKPGGDPVVTLGDTTEFGSPTVLTVLEREGNWVGVPTEKLDNGELGWLKLKAGTDAYDVDSVDEEIVVDVSSMTAEFRRDGEVKRSWTVSVGAAESPTPTGHFAVTDTLENTFSASYGCCVLPITATQPNTPPGWSGGNRMAIHGTTSPLGLANSNGCVRNGESDMRFLMAQAPLGTPVTIRN